MIPRDKRPLLTTFNSPTAFSTFEPAAAFTWDGGISPTASVVRTVSPFVLNNVHEQMRGCVLNADGTVNYYLNPVDWSLKATGGASVLTGEDGNVMVEIPRFYFRVSRVGSDTTWEVSPLQLAGFEVHPAFVKDGVEVLFRYYGAYDASVFRVARAITGATAANPVVITSNAHGLLTANTVTITGVVGMTELNGRTFTVTRVSSNTYSLDGEDGTGHTPYTSGGTWSGHINGLNFVNNSGANGVGVNVTASTGDKLASVAGYFPMVGLNRAEFRTIGFNIGAGWRQLDFHLWQAVGLLYLVEYQTFFNQNVLGAGNTNGTYFASSGLQTDSPHTIAGAGNSWANGSTDGSQPSAGAKPGTAYMRYRGIENLFGNKVDWADGININVTATGNVHVTNNSADWADNTSTNYTLISSSLTTSSANIQSLLAADPWFLAASTGGTSAQYVTDRHFGSALSNRAAFVGGAANAGGGAGVFGLFADNVSGFRNRDVGGRLTR